MEVDYWRRRYQRMNPESFVAANVMALITHTITQPLDTVRLRSQMLQEGKTFIGLGVCREVGTHSKFLKRSTLLVVA